MEPATALPTGVDDRAGRQRGHGRRPPFAARARPATSPHRATSFA